MRLKGFRVRAARPPRELELVFLLAGTDARRAELSGAAREVLERADFGLLEEELRDRRLLPLIGSRALAVGADLAPEGFRDAVDRARAAARAQGLAVEWATRRVVTALEAAGIRALPLKGPLLASDVHGDVGMRETADADVLVGSERLDGAVRVLLDDGFAAPTDPRDHRGLPDLHFAMDHPTLARIELHWRVHWYDRGFSQDMLARADAGADGLPRPGPDDLAASLLLFYARDGLHGVRPVADLAAWWDRYGGDLSGPFLEGHVRSYPELAPALAAAAISAERVGGVPATGWLGGGLRAGRRIAMATRLGDWTQHGNRDQLRANISLVDALLGPPGSARAFIRRELLRGGAGGIARAVHGAKVAFRYGLALWGVRGSRSWASVPASVDER